VRELLCSPPRSRRQQASSSSSFSSSASAASPAASLSASCHDTVPGSLPPHTLHQAAITEDQAALVAVPDRDDVRAAIVRRLDRMADAPRSSSTALQGNATSSRSGCCSSSSGRWGAGCSSSQACGRGSSTITIPAPRIVDESGSFSPLSVVGAIAWH
jgi:hypothetical protein